jgi:two-component system KDP operon response regulator KdpE
MPTPVILVVDDDAPILLLMQSLLRGFGFEPVAVNSGAKALDEARKRTPDLILLDRHMPGMSGEDVLRELRGNDALASVPVLILSGEPIEPDELRALGATGAVLKPFDVAELVETIRQHL